MTTTVRQIAYRLKSDGKAEVIRDAREVGDAYRASYGQAEAGANAASAAADRQEQRYRRLAQAARDSAQAEVSQARFNAALGVDRGGAASARESAAVFAAQGEAMEEAERRARSLRAMLDPLGAAQDRLNDELREYDRLAKAGQISTNELAQAQRLARQRFDEQAVAIERNTRGLSRMQVASRMNLARQVPDVAVTLAGGMNPAMVALQQGPQILDALATSGIKSSRSMLMLGGALGAAAVASGVAVAAWHSAEGQALSLERVTSGLGRTAGLNAREVEAYAQAASAASNISVRAGRAMAAEYLSTGRIGGAVLTDLIELTKDYASFTGQDLAAAQTSLAQAMVSPDKAAREMTVSFGLLDRKQLDLIDSYMRAGDQMRAQQVLIEALNEAVSGHAGRVGEIESAWDAAARAAMNAWDWIGRALYRSRDERIETLERQLRPESQGGVTGGMRRQMSSELGRLQYDAYWEEQLDDRRSDQAKANQGAELVRRRREAAAREARRGRRGPDPAREAEREAREAEQRRRREEDVRAQLDLEVARLTNQVDLVRQLEDENAIRRRTRELIDAEVDAGKARQTAEQEQVRILDARAEAANREMGTMLRSAELEASRIDGMNALVAKYERDAELQNRIEKYLRQHLDLTTATNAAKSEQAVIDGARLTAANRIADAAAREHRLTLAQLAGRREEYDRLSRADRVESLIPGIASRNNWNQDDRRARGEALRIVNEEVAAEAQGARRAWISDFVSDIRRSGIGDAIAEQLERATDRMLSKLIDQLMEVDWAKTFNQASGSTGGGFGSFFSSVASVIFGGKPVGQNAQGTDFWRGGLTWVGERGPELLDLPRGSRVTEHNRSMQLAVASASATPVVDLGGLTIKNYGSEPVTGRMKRGSNGGLELELEPLFKGMLGRAGKDGTLARAVGASPRPRKR